MPTDRCNLGDLKFTLKPELDWHCREEHPGFRHDYAGPWQHPEDKAVRDAPPSLG